MGLLRAEIRNFRCLQQLDLELDPQYTLVCGPNASGKTSLLEALFFLGRGRSFRTRHLERLIQTGAERFVIYGESSQVARIVNLGVEGSIEGTRAQISGSPAQSLADLSLVLPVQVIDPEVHKLIEEGPVRRRRYLDWGTFHVEHDFVEYWRRYHQTLRQRNAALKSGATRSSLEVWDMLLAEAGERIAQSRQRYIELLTPTLRDFGHRLLGGEVSASVRRGWPRGQTLLGALQANVTADQTRGATQFGPHRADLVVRMDGGIAKEVVSRGQQKLLASALLLAQLGLLDAGQGQATLLLDDPAAELDANRLSRLIELVRDLPVQLVVTSLSAHISGLGSPGRRYVMMGGSVARS